MTAVAAGTLLIVRGDAGAVRDTRIMGVATLLSGSVLVAVAARLHGQRAKRQCPAVTVAPLDRGAIGLVAWSLR